MVRLFPPMWVTMMALRLQRRDALQLSAYGADLVFLDNFVWPRVVHEQMAHDAFNCADHPNSFPFPTPRRDDFEHVGQVYESDHDRSKTGKKGVREAGRSANHLIVRPEDVAAMKKASSPLACRRHRDRAYG